MPVFDADKVFGGSIPKLYDALLVPLIFEPYAADAAKRLGGFPVARILEVAAGTGVLTRALASALPDTAAIAKRFGRGAVDGKIQAHVVTVKK